MASAPTAQEALRAWLNLLPPDQRRAAESAMGAGWPASAEASHEPNPAEASDEPTPSPSQADPATTPIPEEPNPVFLAQREWYDSQDKIFRGPIPPETPWQDDDLSAQHSSSASQQPTVNETKNLGCCPSRTPASSTFSVIPSSFFKDPAAVDQQPLNRQEMWAAMQFKPIYRTAGRWTYWELLPEDIRKPPPQFCNEIEDAPKQPPASRTQPKEKARPKHVPPSARPSLPPKTPQKDSWADATEQEEASEPTSSSKPKPVQEPKTSSAAADPAVPTCGGRSRTETRASAPQHLRPAESQSFLPKEADPPTKAMPTKPPQTTQPSQGQPAPTDQPGSSNDGQIDLSAAPATVYMPLPGQDLDIDSFRALSQPGASTKPYIFDIGLLDRRAQPLFSQPTYKPIECMLYDRRPWICFYGGSPPKEVAEIDDWWYTMYAGDGGCCLQGWPMFLLQDFVRLFSDPPPRNTSRSDRSLLLYCVKGCDTATVNQTA